MKTYTDAELARMQLDDPMQYFYYSHEEQLTALGVNLANDNWDTPLLYGDNVSRGRNKFEFFYNMLHSPEGLTIHAHDGRVVKLTGNCDVEVLANIPGAEPKFHGEEPGAAPESLGVFFRFMHFITGGRYGAERYEQHEAAVAEYNRKVEAYETAYSEWERTKLEPYRNNVKQIESYREALTAHGKKLDDVKAYMAQDKKRYDKEVETATALRNEKSDAETARLWRERGRERLDYLMGPRRGTERDAEAIRHMTTEECTLHRECFDKDKLADNAKETFVMDIGYPDCKAFSDHQIALIGFADMCSADFINHAYSHPVPGGEEIPDNRLEMKKLEAQGSWYNRTEALFARHKRDASEAVPWVNNARVDVAAALEKYNNGDMTAVAGMLKNGIRWIAHHVMYQTSANDGCTLADFALYAGEMYDMINADPNLRRAVLDAGATAQDLRDAEICGNIGKVWDRGIDAIATLKDNPNLTPDQKADAIADIIGLRMTQDMLLKHGTEIAASDAYKSAYDAAFEEYTIANAEKSAMSKADRNDPVKSKAAADKITEASAKLTSFNMSFLFDQLGIQMEFGDVIDGVYFGNGRPQEIHDMIRKNLDLAELSKCPSDVILTEMLPQNTNRYIKQALPKKPEVKPNAPVVGAPELQQNKQLNQPALPGLH